MHTPFGDMQVLVNGSPIFIKGIAVNTAQNMYDGKTVVHEAVITAMVSRDVVSTHHEDKATNQICLDETHCEETKEVSIEKVIFNPPATIILWSDKEKTVVKSQPGEIYDPEKGLAMAICKRMMGNTGSYYEEFKLWLSHAPENRPELKYPATLLPQLSEIQNEVKMLDEALTRASCIMKKRVGTVK